MSGMTGFLIAVGIISVICFALIMRTHRVRDRGRAYANSPASNPGGISSGNDGFSILNWFGGSSSSPSDGACNSSSSSFFSDSNCGDGGGGGGGGGGD